MTVASSSSTAIGLIVAGFIVDITVIVVLIRASRRAKTSQKRSGAPWPQAALLVLGFGAILIGAGAMR